eukprot:CAMPEP_0113952814 /NCGR_PEP_ID=MMETSP1339-20121228/90633_1 /TAXON_ID=94617 /ORGANISM="Fibrocapsa japonica" /LENGTH=334 /DNA_ID=CAMNT_0000961479 /DNA_START=235 /DNA_END=1237 /DNA_ORIENTATION=+ /assembly_acc=CAM_ASM_000762
MTAEGKDHTDNKFHKAAAAFALGLGLFVGGSNCANSAVLSNTPIKDPTLSIVKDEKELNLALKRVWDGETRDDKDNTASVLLATTVQAPVQYQDTRDSLNRFLDPNYVPAPDELRREDTREALGRYLHPRDIPRQELQKKLKQDPTLSIVKDEKELNLALKRVWDGETRDETFVVHNDFSWVLATYPVGLLVRKYYLDQMRQEEAAEDTAIDPDCADCNNRLEVACPACDGRGFFMVAEAGGVGGGRGKPAQLPRTCVMCEGTGGVPCPACELAKNQAKYQTKEEDPPEDIGRGSLCHVEAGGRERETSSVTDSKAWEAAVCLAEVTNTKGNPW